MFLGCIGNLVIQCASSFRYAQSIEEGGAEFDKLKIFLCGWLGLDNASTISSAELLLQAIKFNDWRLLEFLLPHAFDPTFPDIQPSDDCAELFKG